MPEGGKLASPGANFRSALLEERPLQVAGAINAYTARLAQATGFRALYLSGGGVAANSLGLPDLGISTMEDVLTDVRRITDASSLPLLVDIDTGWGGAFNIARTIRSMINAGATAVHMEDQVGQKRCGHRPGKELVPVAEMVDRIKAAVDARTDEQFVMMARTDALANEGLASAIERAQAYVAAGADMIFAEAVTELGQYTEFRKAVGVPILANITEFGQTPLWTREELGAAGVDMVLYCCGAYRAMNAAALKVYEAIRNEGTQKNVVNLMQSRADLYKYLDYHAYEEKLDALFAKDNVAQGQTGARYQIKGSMTVADLFKKAAPKLNMNGPVLWDQEIPKTGAGSKKGVYVVARVQSADDTCGELESPPFKARPSHLEIDSEYERTRWLPKEAILYIGETDRPIQKRVSEFYKHIVGAKSKHAGGQIAKLLAGNLWVYWAATENPKKVETEMLRIFKEETGNLPFANSDRRRKRVVRH
jgi:methylisocitrate lyase